MARKRAPRGSRSIIDRVNQIIETTSPREASRLLGVSTSSVYRMRKAKSTPAREVIGTKSTLEAWEDRLSSASARAMSTSRDMEDLANIVSAGTGEDWSPDEVARVQEKYLEGQIDYREPPSRGEPPSGEPPDSGRPPFIYDDEPSHQWEINGVRFVDKGYTWVDDDGEPRVMVEHKEKAFQTEEEVIAYMKQVTNAQYVLVAQKNVDADGNEWYEIYLDIIS